jgi:hypothetical protein
LAEGTLIAESLEIGVPLRGVDLRVTEVVRRVLGGLPIHQPSVWTFIGFTIDDSEAIHVSRAIASALSDLGGWYCDFRTQDETFVVFPRKVYRYRRGDENGRHHAAAHARAIGIPENQIDWPE